MTRNARRSPGPAQVSGHPAFAMLGVAAAVIGLSWPLSAQAEFPDHSVRIVVAFAPGGASDLIARIISAPLQEALHQPVIVENHPGANGNIGIGLVAKAPPDGYTVLVASSVIFVNAPLKRPGSYEADKDFTPLADLGGSPDALVTRAENEITDFADLMARAKARPGYYTFSSPGIGSISQLGVEMLDLRTGMKLTHVPYTGAAPAVQAALAGTTHLAAVNISAAIPLVKAGKLRALVQTGSEPWFELPDVPTFGKAGIVDADSETIQVLLAPKGTPAAIAERLGNEVVAILKNPRLRDNLLKTGFAVSGEGPAAAKKRVDEEVAKWRGIITSAGLKVN